MSEKSMVLVCQPHGQIVDVGTKCNAIFSPFGVRLIQTINFSPYIGSVFEKAPVRATPKTVEKFRPSL